MGEIVNLVYLAPFTAPFESQNFQHTQTASFDYKSQIVGLDVTETSDNFYTLGLVCVRDQFTPIATHTRFFRVMSALGNPVLNNETMYIGGVQIKTFCSPAVHGTPAPGRVDLGRTMTLHVFEESVS